MALLLFSQLYLYTHFKHFVPILPHRATTFFRGNSDLNVANFELATLSASLDKFKLGRLNLNY
jgi:hypothetical protein